MNNGQFVVTRFARTTNYNLNLRRCLRFKLLFFPLTTFGEKIGRLFSVYFAPCEKVIFCRPGETSKLLCSGQFLVFAILLLTNAMCLFDIHEGQISSRSKMTRKITMLPSRKFNMIISQNHKVTRSHQKKLRVCKNLKKLTS